MTPQRTFKVRSFVNGTAKNGRWYKHYSLTVPREIAERIPDGMTFVPRMTEDGILYEPRQQIEDQIELPSWLQNNRNSQDTEPESESDENEKTESRSKNGAKR